MCMRARAFFVYKFDLWRSVSEWKEKIETNRKSHLERRAENGGNTTDNQIDRAMNLRY